MNGRSMLRDRSMGALLIAEVISGFGSWMTYLALPWFVLTTTGSPTRMGLVLGAELVPIAVLGVPSGEVVTRLGARATMLVGDVGRVPYFSAQRLILPEIASSTAASCRRTGRGLSPKKRKGSFRNLSFERGASDIRAR
jgi:MFS family permease